MQQCRGGSGTLRAAAELCCPSLECKTHGRRLGTGEFAVVEAIKLVEGVRDGIRCDSGIELLGPANASGAPEPVDEGVEIGEVAPFGAVDGSEDLAGGKILGCEYRNPIDQLDGEERWRVDGEINIDIGVHLARDEASEGFVRTDERDLPPGFGESRGQVGGERPDVAWCGPGSCRDERVNIACWTLDCSESEKGGATGEGEVGRRW